MKATILVYRNQPLPISETFIYNQTMRLNRYAARFLGAKLPKGPRIPLPDQRVYLVNQGGVRGWLREVAFKFGGYVPSDVLRWARQFAPVLIHAHFGPDGAVAMPLAKALGVPLIVSFHGSDATIKDRYVWRSSYHTHRLYLLRRRSLVRFVTRVIVQSEFLHRLVVEHQGFPEEKVVLIRHGIDLKEFRPVLHRTEWGHVLYVGRLIETKGLPYLIRAIRRVRQRFPDVRLTIIGDGAKRSEYEALAVNELGHGFVFLGAQPQRVVKEFLERAYVFCMPSVTMPSGEAETLGLVFVEAMAMKVPVISFRSGGIPEVIVHGKTGFMAKERDIDGLARFLSMLLENPSLRERMGNTGREWIEREFDLAKQNAKLEAVYDEVLAEHGKEGTLDS